MHRFEVAIVRRRARRWSLLSRARAHIAHVRRDRARAKQDDDFFERQMLINCYLRIQTIEQLKVRVVEAFLIGHTSRKTLELLMKSLHIISHRHELQVVCFHLRGDDFSLKEWI